MPPNLAPVKTEEYNKGVSFRILLSCIAITCCGADRTETLDAAGGQKITREFYPDGTISYDLSRTTNKTAFAERKRESEKRTAQPSRSGDWRIYKFADEQGDTRYDIREAYRTLGPEYGVHVRLAFPELPKTTREWRQTLEADFKKLLETTEARKTK